MTIFGYARVSIDGQPLDAQLEALKAAGCEKVFQEKVSGASSDRAQLARLLTEIDSGDVLIVSRLDRLARSTRDLLNVFGTLAERGAAFHSLGDQWADITIPQWGEAQARLAASAITRSDPARRFDVSQSTMSHLADKAAAPHIATLPAIDPETRRAARAFLERIEGRYPVQEAFLFGSRARHTHRLDSDADVAVILKGERGNRHGVAGDMAEVAFDVMMETSVLVDPTPLWEHEMQRPERFSNPMLIDNIKRDGLRL